MLDKKDYIVRQLNRTHNKVFENYVITRIWHLLNDLDIKIVTQQYILRPQKGYALADLYFPQFNLIVEVDEEQHLGNKLNDSIRDRDIVNAVNFETFRIDTSRDIEYIHGRIDELINIINNKKRVGFKKWDYEREFDIQQYIDKGYIDVKDNAIFKTQKDVYNCFGGNYKHNVRHSCLAHKFIKNVAIWHPKLYEYGQWHNEISPNENTIFESNVDINKNRSQLDKWLNSPRNIRYVFAHSKDNLGRVLYRFKGVYRLNKERTVIEEKAVWERISTRVNTVSNTKDC